MGEQDNRSANMPALIFMAAIVTALAMVILVAAKGSGMLYLIRGAALMLVVATTSVIPILARLKCAHKTSVAGAIGLVLVGWYIGRCQVADLPPDIAEEMAGEEFGMAFPFLILGALAIWLSRMHKDVYVRTYNPTELKGWVLEGLRSMLYADSLAVFRLALGLILALGPVMIAIVHPEQMAWASSPVNRAIVKAISMTSITLLVSAIRVH